MASLVNNFPQANEVKNTKEKEEESLNDIDDGELSCTSWLMEEPEYPDKDHSSR